MSLGLRRSLPTAASFRYMYSSQACESRYSRAITRCGSASCGIVSDVYDIGNGISRGSVTSSLLACALLLRKLALTNMVFLFDPNITSTRQGLHPQRTVTRSLSSGHSKPTLIHGFLITHTSFSFRHGCPSASGSATTLFSETRRRVWHSSAADSNCAVTIWCIELGSGKDIPLTEAASKTRSGEDRSVEAVEK